MDIIKIGGSVITDKTKYRKLNPLKLRDLSTKIAEWGKRCILIHGAGSFGHIVAEEHGINLGFESPTQLQGIAQIGIDMSYLNNSVVSSLHKEGLKAIGFQTSALVYDKGDGKFSYLFDPVKKALDLGLLPVLHGDIVFKDTMGFSILSGDYLIKLLVEEFDINRVIFITDVDGLLIKKPKAKKFDLVKNLSEKELDNFKLDNLDSPETIDVTGSMLGKLEIISSIIERIEKVILVNGNKPKRVELALEDTPTISTIITK